MFYFACFAVGLLGTAIGVLVIIKGIAAKAASGNIQFSYAGYFKSDWFTPALSILLIGVALIFLYYAQSAESHYIKYVSDQILVLAFFLLIGLAPNFVINTFLGVATKRINAAIDYKTNIADTQTGNMGSPTPAAPVEKKK